MDAALCDATAKNSFPHTPLRENTRHKTFSASCPTTGLLPHSIEAKHSLSQVSGLLPFPMGRVSLFKPHYLPCQLGFLTGPPPRASTACRAYHHRTTRARAQPRTPRYALRARTPPPYYLPWRCPAPHTHTYTPTPHATCPTHNPHPYLLLAHGRAPAPSYPANLPRAALPCAHCCMPRTAVRPHPHTLPAPRTQLGHHLLGSVKHGTEEDNDNCGQTGRSTGRSGRVLRPLSSHSHLHSLLPCRH